MGLPVSALLLIAAWRDRGFERIGHLHTDVHDLLAWDDPWRRADVEAGVTAGVMHVRVGISPGHLLDWVLGLFTLDLAHDDRGVAFDDPAEPESEWLAGTLHEHADPPGNCAGQATESPEDLADLAASNGCDFLGLNDHAWSADAFTSEYAQRVQALCAHEDDPIVLPGWEIFRRGNDEAGHALLVFRDPADAFRPRPDLVRSTPATVMSGVATNDVLMIPAHPRTRALQLPFVPDYANRWEGAAALYGPEGESHEITPGGGLVVRWPAVSGSEEHVAAAAARAWSVAGERARKAGVERFAGTATVEGRDVAFMYVDPDTDEPVVERVGAPDDVPAGTFDGLEALTLLHHLGELAVGRAGDELAFDDVFRVLDAHITAGRRRVTVTGGADSHRDVVLPTMWVLARARTRDAIFDAVRDGRVVIGGDEACSLEARTDEEPAWRPIGADLRATAWVELRWRGTGTLVIDGERRPADTGPFRHELARGAFHAYRLEAGPGRRSRSAWIYVNRV